MSQSTQMNTPPQRFGFLPPFLRPGRASSYLSVVMAGQIPYSAFEAFKGALLLPLCMVLGISIEQFGILMGWIGIAMFLYVPGGWINNRFPIKHILLAWCGWRLLTYLLIFLVPGLSFKVFVAVAISWAVWDAIGWPAVVNGVSFLTEKDSNKGRGMAMGLLETIRRASEMIMNIIIVALMAVSPENSKTIMFGFALGYALLLIPMMLWIMRSVPANAIAKEENTSDNIAALKGLVRVLSRPRVWLAGLAAMCVYWSYVELIYASAPYVKLVYSASDSVSGAFGIFNTGLVGVFAGLVAGFCADYIFKSSTMMMAVSLSVTAIGSFAVYLLPSSKSMLYVSMLLLMVMSIGVFMGKAVILAPIAEIHLPQSINGSAMAVGSFLAYAPVFWANPLTAGLVEKGQKAGDVAGAYSTIFLITVVVSLCGAICAFLLALSERKTSTKAKVA